MVSGMSEPDRRVAVVTGGTAGVGRATVREFAERGYDVAILARGDAGLEAAAAEVTAAGGRALPLAADVADHEAVRQAADRVESELGPIGVWVNAAFCGSLAFSWDTRMEEWRRMTDVTYFGQVHGTLAALERMRPRDRGVIVNVGSAMAYRSIPLQSAYCGAKFAIRGFTDSLRCELLHEQSNVRLTMVQLSAFNTPQFDWARCHMDRAPQPLPPIYQPEVAAAAIVRAAQRRRREVWVGWPAVKAIMGQRLAPGLLDRMMASSGYSGQLSARPTAPDRPDNLYQAIPGDRGARGRFSGRARDRSWQYWLTSHPAPTFAACAAAGLLIGAAVAGLARSPDRPRLAPR